MGNDQQTPLYVGKSINVLSRLGSHLSGHGGISREFVWRVRTAQLVRCVSAVAMDRTEARADQPLPAAVQHYRLHNERSDQVVHTHIYVIGPNPAERAMGKSAGWARSTGPR
jgi:hypothetical protein